MNKKGISGIIEVLGFLAIIIMSIYIISEKTALISTPQEQSSIEMSNVGTEWQTNNADR